MSEKGFKRKLTAILSADVEGYSRLMGENEEATVRTLTAHREVMTTIIQQYRGRVVDSPRNVSDLIHVPIVRFYLIASVGTNLFKWVRHGTIYKRFPIPFLLLS